MVDDPALLEEVAGLVEWPVPLLGRIDPTFMDLPPEVRQVSMRVNQRYFALRCADGSPAPWFGFVANIEADEAAQRSLPATSVCCVRALPMRGISGTWIAGHRWRRACRSSTKSRSMRNWAARASGCDGCANSPEPSPRRSALIRHLAERAAELAKADLLTGMVGEFPELQGVMGRYYALHDGEPSAVADAIRDHYAPKGPNDAVPTAPVSIAVALADKLDQLAGFFAIGEKPTGSGDPYALRRAALGVIRITWSGQLRLPLRSLHRRRRWPGAACRGCLPASTKCLAFIAERLRVQLRGRRGAP